MFWFLFFITKDTNLVAPNNFNFFFFYLTVCVGQSQGVGWPGPLLRISPGWTLDSDKGCNLIWRSRVSSTRLSAEVIVMPLCDGLTAVRECLSPAVLVPQSLTVCFISKHNQCCLTWPTNFPGIISLVYFRAIFGRGQ